MSTSAKTIELTIGEVAHRAGVATSALRYYESAGLIPRTRRVNGRRRYDASVFEALGLIHLAQQAGFTIREIRALLNDYPQDAAPSARWQKIATRKLVEVDALISEAQSRRRMLEKVLACQCATLEDCAQFQEVLHG